MGLVSINNKNHLFIPRLRLMDFFEGVTVLSISPPGSKLKLWVLNLRFSGSLKNLISKKAGLQAKFQYIHILVITLHPLRQ